MWSQIGKRRGHVDEAVCSSAEETLTGPLGAEAVGSEISVVPHETGKHLVARIGLDLAQLVQASGGSEIFMVAGAATGRASALG